MCGLEPPFGNPGNQLNADKANESLPIDDALNISFTPSVQERFPLPPPHPHPHPHPHSPAQALLAESSSSSSSCKYVYKRLVSGLRISLFAMRRRMSTGSNLLLRFGILYRIGPAVETLSQTESSSNRRPWMQEYCRRSPGLE